MSIDAIAEATKEMGRTPGSTVTMCQDQAKVAVFTCAENAILMEERE